MKIKSLYDLDNRNQDVDNMYDMLGKLDKLLVDT
jgi:hypothetical protein